MGGNIFISYRRSDSQGVAGRLFDQLAKQFSRRALFMDVDTIAPGSDFVAAIDSHIAQCAVLLAVIGPRWLDAADEGGRRRLDDPKDFVQIEIAAALRRRVHVIPVLVDGAAMMHAADLPEDLQDLARRNGIELRHTRFTADAEQLMAAIKKVMPALGRRRLIVPASLLGTAAAVLIAAFSGVLPIPGLRQASLPKEGSGRSFQDCTTCPELVVAPAGHFMMGAGPDIRENAPDEQPRHEVAFAAPFAVGRYAVTFAEWDAAQLDPDWVRITERPLRKPDDRGWGRGHRPVIDVSWEDAEAFAKWLAAKTGKRYELLSKSEREYVTRAGTTTLFWWGNEISPKQANYDSSGLNPSDAASNAQKTLPVDSFAPNPWGLYNVHGNVEDWVEDCYRPNYDAAPRDGTARPAADCPPGDRVTRGGSWIADPSLLRASSRRRVSEKTRSSFIGFRIVREVGP